ncbi:geranylgeranyl pyrophosphate synthetase protein [Apiospora marii]|uniref:Geranylgeranyl pyrophosphate synthetase protein n=1 Tax=Apiospora marii TaxID=335849 RepID=A0ABR1RKU6_9PEZI
MEVALELTGLLGPASALTDPLGCGATGLAAGLSYGSRQVSLASNGRAEQLLGVMRRLRRALPVGQSRKMVREAFDERFRASAKQQAELDKWSLNRGSVDESQEDDATTEAGESDDGFDSDWSY